MIMASDDTTIATAVREFADSVPAPAGLAEQVINAARTGPIRGTARPDRARRVWLPIAVCALVAVLAVLLAVLGHTVRHHAAPPAVSHTSSPVPSPQRVSVGGAALDVPAGWTVEPTKAPTTWCLLPPGQSLPPNGNTEVCAATFFQVPAGSRGVQLSPDTTGGEISNPEWCGQVLSSDVTWRLLDYHNRVFGGRDADYRRWTITCKNTATTWDIEQYVIDSAPAYVVFSDHADPPIHAALAVIAANSTLPKATGGLRYSDLGRVRTLTHDSTGYHLSIDRVVDDQGTGQYVTVGGTYDYLASETVLAGRAAPTVGALVELTTDGQTVTSLRVL